MFITSLGCNSALPNLAYNSSTSLIRSFLAVFSKALSVALLPKCSNAALKSCCPIMIYLSRSASRSARLIAVFALPVSVISSHVACGSCPIAVRISIDWPFLNLVQRGARNPSIFAPTQEFPIRV